MASTRPAADSATKATTAGRPKAATSAKERAAAGRPALEITIIAGHERRQWTLPAGQVWRRGIARRVRAAIAPHFGDAPYGVSWAVFANGGRRLWPLIDSVVKEAYFRGWQLEARRSD